MLETSVVVDRWLHRLRSSAESPEVLAESWRAHVPQVCRFPDTQVQLAAAAHWRFLADAVVNTSTVASEHTAAIRAADTTGRQYYDGWMHQPASSQLDSETGAVTAGAVYRAMAWFGVLSRRLADESGVMGAIPVWRGVRDCDGVPAAVTAVSSVATTFKDAANRIGSGCVLHARVKAEAVIGVTVNDPVRTAGIEIELHPIVAPYVLAQGPTSAASGPWRVYAQV